MEFSAALDLDAAGQVALVGEEVQYRIQGDVTIYDRENKSAHVKGALAVTSHRLYWTDAARRSAIQWHLRQVVDIRQEEAGMFAGSAKVVVSVISLGAASRPGGGTAPSPLPAASAAPYVKFSFKNGGRDAFLESLKLAHSRRGWEKAAPVPRGLNSLGGPTMVPATPAALGLTAATATTRTAGSSGTPGGGGGAGGGTAADDMPMVLLRPGLSGLAATNAERIAASKAIAQSAFSDLEALAKHAASIVSLAEGYAIELKAQREREVEAERERIERAAALTPGADGSPTTALSGGAGTPTTPAVSSPTGRAGMDEDTLGSLVSSLGIVAPLATPVTKESAGSLYLQEMARQLASFLRPRLESSGGMMLLTDVYCMYNRARGTQLISPEDLLAALALFPQLAVGMRVRIFNSGGSGSSKGGSSGSATAGSGASPLTVLQLDSRSDDAMVAGIATMLTAKAREAERRAGVAQAGTARDSPQAYAEDAYLSPLDLTAAWRLPLPLARQALLLAEGTGAVVRDDSIHGLRFYLNRF